MISVAVIYMLKYSNYEITFAEIPDEITLCINLTNCPYQCEFCHSPWLREDSGTGLTWVEICKLINENVGISCICFMGGSKEPWEISRLAKLIKETYSNLKVAWYSGDDFDVDNPSVAVDNRWFDYIKLGPYKHEFGPLTSKTTNQRMYYNTGLSSSLSRLIGWTDITYKFWKNDNNND